MNILIFREKEYEYERDELREFDHSKAVEIYSLLATCKISGVEPFAWLKSVLDTIPDYPANQLHRIQKILKEA
jgi:hypothetical protein